MVPIQVLKKHLHKYLSSLNNAAIGLLLDLPVQFSNHMRGTDSGKHGMTELFSKTSEMVPNGLNLPMYES